MDLERAILRTLFYDYPIEVAVRGINNISLRREENEFLIALPQVIRWTQPEFSISELRLIEDLLNYEARETLFSNEENKTNIFQDTLCLIPQVAKRWLHYNRTHQLTVHYNELFRWRDMTLYVGEDIFTTAYMAWDDIRQHRKVARVFCWEDILHHDNDHLNEILRQEMADVHSHYNASVDVFHLNWLSLMNRIEDRVKFDFDKGDYQENSVSLHAVEQIFKFKNICVAAAFLRVQLFKFIEDNFLTFKVEEFKQVFDILKDDDKCNRKQTRVQSDISALGKKSLLDIHGHGVDYAIHADAEKLTDSPFVIYQGEREILYSLFRYIFDSGYYAYDVAPYFYLYLLLKNRIRREIVETNQLLGFENFQTYQSRKNIFIKSKKKDKKDNIYLHSPQFIVRMNLYDGYKIEERVSPDQIEDILSLPSAEPVFTNEKRLEHVNEDMSLVAHFIKDSHIRATYQIKKDATRENEETKRLNDWFEQADKIIEIVNRQQNPILKQEKPLVVGIDAASMELYCRPERFGLIYRYLDQKGIHNRTFHVGEDFFDLVDGLRAIDEAIEFLGLDCNCRLGHALALGTTPYIYYKDRFYTTVIYKQYMLDSLVWLYQKAEMYNVTISGNLQSFIFDNAYRLYNELYSSIVKKIPFDIRTYWYSIWFRSNDYRSHTAENKSLFSNGDKLTRYEGRYASLIENNYVAFSLWKSYLTDKDCYKNGMKAEIFKWPMEIVEVVTQIQDKMIAEIAEKQIAIECNPSSNLKIGHFNRYDEHPIFRFRPIDKNIHTPLLNVSINTDDRGVFGTSLYNEFSLIALALTKQRDEKGNRLYNDEAICEYIDHIRKNNLLQRFKM